MKILLILSTCHLLAQARTRINLNTFSFEDDEVCRVKRIIKNEIVRDCSLVPATLPHVYNVLTKPKKIAKQVLK
jgi:hypothetical protein